MQPGYWTNLHHLSYKIEQWWTENGWDSLYSFIEKCTKEDNAIYNQSISGD